MKEFTLPEVKATVGHQNPLVPGLEKLFYDMGNWHPEADLFDLLEMKPQMWACHSVRFEWGELPILSFSHLNTETGKLTTEFIILFHKDGEKVSDKFLMPIRCKLEDLIFQDVDETITEIMKVKNGEKPTKRFTSTFITIELMRNNCDRNTEED